MGPIYTVIKPPSVWEVFKSGNNVHGMKFFSYWPCITPEADLCTTGTTEESPLGWAQNEREEQLSDEKKLGISTLSFFTWFTYVCVNTTKQRCNFRHLNLASKVLNNLCISMPKNKCTHLEFRVLFAETLPRPFQFRHRGDKSWEASEPTSYNSIYNSLALMSCLYISNIGTEFISYSVNNSGYKGNNFNWHFPGACTLSYGTARGWSSRPLETVTSSLPVTCLVAQVTVSGCKRAHHGRTRWHWPS